MITAVRLTEIVSGNPILRELPSEVQNRVLKALTAFDRVYITFEYDRYIVSPSIGIKSSYGADHKFIGEVTAAELYTLDERTENYIETFHTYPIWYTGKRDYAKLKELYGE